MTGRDNWTEILDCPKCRKTGTVKLSQANGQAFHDGDQDVRVELVPNGFKVLLTEYGSKFYCTTCDTSADHRMPIRHPKRPRDRAQLAKLIVDIATGEVEDRAPTPRSAKSVPPKQQERTGVRRLPQYSKRTGRQSD